MFKNVFIVIIIILLFNNSLCQVNKIKLTAKKIINNKQNNEQNLENISLSWPISADIDKKGNIYRQSHP